LSWCCAARWGGVVVGVLLGVGQEETAECTQNNQNENGEKTKMEILKLQ